MWGWTWDFTSEYMSESMSGGLYRLIFFGGRVNVRQLIYSTYMLHMSTFCHCLKLPWGSHEVTCFNFCRRFSCELWEIFDNTSCPWCQCHGLCGVQKHGWKKYKPKNGCVLNMISYDSSHELIGPQRSCYASQVQLFHHIGELQHHWDSDSARLLRRSWRKNEMSSRWKGFPWVVIDSGFNTGCWIQNSCLAVWKPVISLLDGGDPFVVEVDEAEFRMVLGPA